MRRHLATIIGIGQDAAGDDGVGIAVAQRLRSLALPDGVEVIECAEPSSVITQLIDGPDRIIFIDAVVDGGSSGRVLQFDPAQTDAASALQPLSTHGIGLLEAIHLARTLDSAAMRRQIAIVAITIDQPARYRTGLSKLVAAAVLPAADLALRLAAA